MGARLAYTATRTSGSDSGVGAFLDESLLKLGQRRKDVKDKLARGGRGVELDNF